MPPINGHSYQLVQKKIFGSIAELTTYLLFLDGDVSMNNVLR